ncbi:hypothetical protein B0T17DRAFT_71819 [Bombardia bombarda]|uniref:Transmembrane protein n=1 Tax=Bombardia bombarda TaxID=252184 RepID=A0AA39XLN1_9PEZI|nr:hypothetical protein B0T17DRAFT_71819 [Bombardia bombarda]
MCCTTKGEEAEGYDDDDMKLWVCVGYPSPCLSVCYFLFSRSHLYKPSGYPAWKLLFFLIINTSTTSILQQTYIYINNHHPLHNQPTNQPTTTTSSAFSLKSLIFASQLHNNTSF